ncbi:GtrA family protein [Caballeronia sp. ATUFL_M2_KS44]|uniref:GtrA family protein n=1 Tax=Caballeronia sp. ATUFL_M2_KS44 TaxID=2921767 RepID=UPI0020284429|nr:GtrA family protein [Caballeronia sp. ATUFL_M2_KS44]
MMNSQFFRFAIAGAIGFAVDAGVLYLALACGLGPFFGRVLSFLAAVWVTWQINRRYTFSQRAMRSAWAEWWRYVLSMLSGASVNYAVYSLVIVTGPRSSWLPLAGVACGSIAGMFINFFAAKFWVFGK